MFDLGRIPVPGPPGFLTCPGGDLAARRHRPEQVLVAARRLLDAANARDPDPETLWHLMDPSIRALFSSYRAFAERVRARAYDPTYDPEEAVVQRPGLGFSEQPPTDDAAIPLLGEAVDEYCGAAEREALARSYWFVLVVFPRTLGTCAGCGIDVFFVTRPGGLRYWTIA